MNTRGSVYFWRGYVAPVGVTLWKVCMWSNLKWVLPTLLYLPAHTNLKSWPQIDSQTDIEMVQWCDVNHLWSPVGFPCLKVLDKKQIEIKYKYRNTVTKMTPFRVCSLSAAQELLVLQQTGIGEAFSGARTNIVQSKRFAVQKMNLVVPCVYF